MKIKICGQTSLADSQMSVNCGADFLGVVLDVEWSPRSLSVDMALPIFSAFGDITFLLTFNRSVTDSYIKDIEALRPYALQLTGQETPQMVVDIKERVNIKLFKSIHLAPESENKNMADNQDELSNLMRLFADAGADGFILDSALKGKFGGTGEKHDWSFAANVATRSKLPVFLAGGINPENVAKAAQTPGIYGIDLVSGVEASKGKKSETKLKALFGNLKEK